MRLKENLIMPALPPLGSFLFPFQLGLNDEEQFCGVDQMGYSYKYGRKSKYDSNVHTIEDRLMYCQKGHNS